MGTIEARQRKDGSFSYRVKWDDPTTHRPMSRTFDNEPAALKLNARLIGYNHRLPVEESLVEGGLITVAEYGPQVIALSRGSARYRKDNLTAFNAHIKPHLGRLAVATVNWGDILDWQNALLAKGCAITSIAGYRSGILAPMFKRAQQAGPRGEAPRRTAPSPLLVVPVPVDDNPYDAEILTKEEVSVFFRAAYEVNQNIADLLLLMLATGLRWGEISALTPMGVDLAGGRVMVKQVFAKNEDYQPRLKSKAKTKHSTNRVVPVPRIIYPVLQRLVDGRGHDDLLFVSRAGKPLGYSTFRKTFVRILNKAKEYGLADKPLRPHGLRHSLMTHLGHRNIDNVTIKGVAGWSSMTQGDRYIHLSDQNHAQIVEATSSLVADGMGHAGDPDRNSWSRAQS